MVFSDLLFIFVFLPFFIVGYLLMTAVDKKRVSLATQREKTLHRPMLWRNMVLMIFSLLFYSWGEPVYIFLMLIAVVLNYVFGLLTADAKSQQWKKTWMICGVACDLGILGSFKYLGFFAGTLNSLGLGVSVPEIALPIGISFYIFQSISYLIDVYRGAAPAQRNFFDLLLYISMFPQLIAGPIVRYDTVADEIHDRSVSAEDVSEGSYRFFIGLGKKVIFANVLGEIATQLIGGSLTDLSAISAWVGIIAFTLQIYFDFSGYSDMAIGMGRSVGFHFPENFNYPYTSRSITEFWRRWHISLGSFFRDYVYIPMGGNRRHQTLNIMTVWFLTGMWHGASWNFIIWGLYFGLIVMLEKYTILQWKVPRVIGYLYSLTLIVIGWGIFYFDDFGRLQEFYRAFFGLGSGSGMPIETESLIFDNLWLWIAAIVLCMPVRPLLKKGLEKISSRTPVHHTYAVQVTRAFISVGILVISISLLIGATNNAFIYTRF